MAIVKDQNIPTDQFEDTLDPSIDFKDQYRRALSEGIDHPKLPAGEEIVTFSKKESRPAQRSTNRYYRKPGQQAWRDEFSKCLDCWKAQYDTEEEIDPCHSAGSKHYVEPWEYVPGAKSTYFTQFMSDCLNWIKPTTTTPYPKCQDLIFNPEKLFYCPHEAVQLLFYNGFPPYVVTPSAGSVDAYMVWEAPALWDNCPDLVTFEAVDADGRKACSEISRVTFELAYYSLQMGCGEQQFLSVDPAHPGCPPYLWELEGGGELIDVSLGMVCYFSPETNPNCISNPTITVTDSLGNTAQMKIAVNCYNYGVAFLEYLWSRWPFWDVNCPATIINPTGVCGWEICAKQFMCDGSLFEPGCSAPYSFMKQCTESFYSPELCCLEGGPCEEGNCGPECVEYSPKFLTYSEESYYGYHPHNSIRDIRSEYMKEAGCCPINPLTGLPF